MDFAKGFFIMKTGYIYKIQAPDSKIYIGQTMALSRRLSSHKYYKFRSSLIAQSILTHGYENHKIDIIWKGLITREALLELEYIFMKKYNSFDTDNGLNEKGENDRYSRKLHIKMAAIIRKEKDIPESSRQIWRDRCKNFVWTDEARANLVRGLKNRPPVSNEARARMSANSGKWKSKLVLNFETGIYYDSAKLAGESTQYKGDSFRHLTTKNRPQVSQFKFV